ncbi:GNAT family N-acetyltransferase [Nonomuraea sp. NPDC050663]|uniref:GNAT family N-acetyltransferase n=1 Tax=Nonomuraea sp. NPDC050663 TaxID=3364370 RepID=UPI0037A4D3B3
MNVRELRSIQEFAEVTELFKAIWHFDADSMPVTPELMRALSHAGGYVSGAFDAGRLVGGSVGFLATGNALHSHITGARLGRGIGHELKLHQREWALERGLARITWTYDPLVRRNAHFNLAKLGALPHEYLPSFYGEMADSINQGDDSDRLLAVWELRGCRPEMSLENAAVVLADDGGRPVTLGSDAPTVLVAVPEDIESLRRSEPGTAKAWRLAVREVLGGLIAEGGRVTGFHAKQFYVVSRGTADSSERV